ncbi:MAG: hypothetical protein H6731_00755 [Myxococcales bacterium]|nr:MAG: hypothetical protein H6731_00755 [Myxococcales bacterium]
MKHYPLALNVVLTFCSLIGSLALFCYSSDTYQEYEQIEICDDNRSEINPKIYATSKYYKGVHGKNKKNAQKIKNIGWRNFKKECKHFFSETDLSNRQIKSLCEKYFNEIKIYPPKAHACSKRQPQKNFQVKSGVGQQMISYDQQKIWSGDYRNSRDKSKKNKRKNYCKENYSTPNISVSCGETMPFRFICITMFCQMW